MAKLRFTRKDLVAAYDHEGDFDKAAYLMGMSTRQFGKLWRDLVGAAPPRSADLKPKKRKRIGDELVHKVAFISDLHFGSRYQCLEELHDFCKVAKKRGVKTLVCVGDISDGLKMHNGMEEEQFLHKPKDILNYLVDNYPKGFDKNLFITGNHDFSLQKHGCVNIGESLAEERQDLIYIGHDSGYVTIDGDLSIYLHHGVGGCAEERTKRQQDMALKLVSVCKRDLPHMLVTGHCHAESLLPRYMGMFCLSLGCFQRQTPYLKERGLYPDVSGMIMTYQVIQGRLINPSMDFIGYYS